MTEQELRQVIEEIDPEGKISQTSMEELIVALREPKMNKTPGMSPSGADLITLLQEKLKEESDWRRKAAIAARIVGLNLDT